MIIQNKHYSAKIDKSNGNLKYLYKLDNERVERVPPLLASDEFKLLNQRLGVIVKKKNSSTQVNFIMVDSQKDKTH